MCVFPFGVACSKSAILLLRKGFAGFKCYLCLLVRNVHAMRIIKNSLFTSIGIFHPSSQLITTRQKNVRDVGGCHRVDKQNNKIILRHLLALQKVS